MSFSDVGAAEVIAICAVIVSVVSIVVAIKTLNAQRRHNKLSLKPIVHISKGDYEDKIFVRVKNYGLGPLIITECEINKYGEKYNTLVDSIGDRASELMWDTFSSNLDGRVLAPQKEFTLLEASFDEDSDNQLKKYIRRSLASTVIIIRYTCVYGDNYPEERERLSWFSR
ncbi:hypothetical protein ERW51_18750 [Aliivibrio finisterrensis]|uniref:hypothetical protein n=1 Tax=Aliivibrio finisterrensis TaxID=511998 RepID=UPI00101F6BA3|nr:hypothetical protein [Aliivibrio finisterrensis]RYU62665.1 hypothetical protein ERW54_19210 [Aliivibrio finisterrensis]RYU64411.1 hypothetical protein ERW51_18750 [Aliivibrio finisterrensis]RYU68335.1 hypothetical protein ERW48_19315 [Aliivibrio finisterrensis]